MDGIVNNNIKTNKYQLNDSIYNDPTFNTDSFNLSSSTRNPLLVVTVTLRGGNKRRETTFSGPTCLLDNGATNSMIKKNTLILRTQDAV